MNQTISSLISLLHLKTFIFGDVFEFHHRTKPKFVHLIVVSVTYFDFQFQKSIAPIILYILHTNKFHYINIEVYNFKMSPI
jgi:hypothetical protein